MRGMWVVTLAMLFLAGWSWAGERDAGEAANQDPFIVRSAGEAKDDARRAACAFALQHLREQVELYKFMHGDRYPTADGKPDGAHWRWELLTRLTTGSDGKQVGPFLLGPVTNPLSGSSTVVGKPEKGAAWLLDGKGQISALDRDGSVIPDPPAPRAARLSSTLSILQALRSQVELYKLQHGDRYPTTSGKPVAAEWSWELLTGKTTDPAGRNVGPYLMRIPENSLTGSCRVVAQPEKSAGWVLTAEGLFNAVSEDGGVLDGNEP